MRKRGEMVAGWCFLAIGAGFTAGAIKLEIGRPTEPLPGFFPFVDGMILVVLSVIFLLNTGRQRIGERAAIAALTSPAIVVLALVVYVAVLETLGFVVSTACLTAVILKVLDTKPGMLLTVSASLSVASYLIFDRLLGVTLPSGSLAALF
jgi:putative tricarboxylic transport membrane protein